MAQTNDVDDPQSQHRATDPAENIEPGMEVEAREGDLGEEDVSKPRVQEVLRDSDGNIEKLVVSKGLVFRKTLEVPVERVGSVEPAANTATGGARQESGTSGGQGNGSSAEAGKVILDTQKEEIQSLTTQARRSCGGSRCEDPGGSLHERPWIQLASAPHSGSFWFHLA